MFLCTNLFFSSAFWNLLKRDNHVNIGKVLNPTVDRIHVCAEYSDYCGKKQIGQNNKGNRERKERKTEERKERNKDNCCAVTEWCTYAALISDL
jgi:hypothetical protein